MSKSPKQVRISELRLNLKGKKIALQLFYMQARTDGHSWDQGRWTRHYQWVKDVSADMVALRIEIKHTKFL